MVISREIVRRRDCPPGCGIERKCPGPCDVKNGKKGEPRALKVIKETANLHPQLFYSYNPTVPADPFFRVFPLPGAAERREFLERKLSFTQNPELGEKFMKFICDKPAPVNLVKPRFYRFVHYSVRYKPELPRPERKVNTDFLPYELGNCHETKKTFTKEYKF